MQNKNAQKYIGRIASVPGNDGFAFIGIDSVSQTNGTHHALDTTADIFLHQDDAGSELAAGKVMTFDVVPDQKRGDGFFRALGAVEYVEAELLPPNEAPMPGFSGALVPFEQRIEPMELYVPPTAAQRAMKQVPPEEVEKAVRNKPVETILRDHSVPADVTELVMLFLRFLFPTMEQFGTASSLDGDEQELKQKLAEAVESHHALGMEEQIPAMQGEVERFLSFRGALQFMARENLIRNDTVIPIRYLPDFFMAVPVWFFWADPNASTVADREWDERDPQVHPFVAHFCAQFGTREWEDMFQMFNRRMRTLKRYKGDIIPPRVVRHIREATKYFDYVVIMTPYLDVAGSDWQDIQWLRSIDPYVVGFKKGIPYFFILARFSDSGTFPLFNELVADTMMFLKRNSGLLRGFDDRVSRPFWFVNGRKAVWPYNLGKQLTEVVNAALAQYEQGNLFNWLRGENQDEAGKK